MLWKLEIHVSNSLWAKMLCQNTKAPCLSIKILYTSYYMMGLSETLPSEILKFCMIFFGSLTLAYVSFGIKKKTDVLTCIFSLFFFGRVGIVLSCLSHFCSTILTSCFKFLVLSLTYLTETKNFHAILKIQEVHYFRST